VCPHSIQALRRQTGVAWPRTYEINQVHTVEEKYKHFKFHFRRQALGETLLGIQLAPVSAGLGSFSSTQVERRPTLRLKSTSLFFFLQG